MSSSLVVIFKGFTRKRKSRMRILIEFLKFWAFWLLWLVNPMDNIFWLSCWWYHFVYEREMYLKLWLRDVKFRVNMLQAFFSFVPCVLVLSLLFSAISHKSRLSFPYFTLSSTWADCSLKQTVIFPLSLLSFLVRLWKFFKTGGVERSPFFPFCCSCEILPDTVWVCVSCSSWTSESKIICITLVFFALESKGFFTCAFEIPSKLWC